MPCLLFKHSTSDMELLAESFYEHRRDATCNSERVVVARCFGDDVTMVGSGRALSVADSPNKVSRVGNSHRPCSMSRH